MTNQLELRCPKCGTNLASRELAREQVFDVGWYPHQDGAPLSFAATGEIGAKAQ